MLGAEPGWLFVGRGNVNFLIFIFKAIFLVLLQWLPEEILWTCLGWLARLSLKITCFIFWFLLFRFSAVHSDTFFLNRSYWFNVLLCLVNAFSQIQTRWKFSFSNLHWIYIDAIILLLQITEIIPSEEVMLNRKLMMFKHHIKCTYVCW